MIFCFVYFSTKFPAVLSILYENFQVIIIHIWNPFTIGLILPFKYYVINSKNNFFMVDIFISNELLLENTD